MDAGLKDEENDAAISVPRAHPLIFHPSHNTYYSAHLMDLYAACFDGLDVGLFDDDAAAAAVDILEDGHSPVVMVCRPVRHSFDVFLFVVADLSPPLLLPFVAILPAAVLLVFLVHTQEEVEMSLA